MFCLLPFLEGGWGSKFNSTSEDGESFENRGGFERNRRGRGAFRGRSNGFGHDHREGVYYYSCN